MTGLIYVAIIAVWAVVLVPAWLRRHDHADPERSVDRFSRSMQTLATRPTVLGIPLPTSQPVTDSDHEPVPEVFRIRRGDLSQASARVGGAATRARSRLTPASAAARRRLVMGVLAAALLGVGALVAVGVLVPAALAVPALLLAGFVGLARHQVRSAARVRPAGSVARAAPAAPQATPVPGRTATPTSGSTWEPRSTPLPTYVTAPPAAGFPRVIDTEPGAWTAAAMLQRAQQEKARAERMAAAKAEAIARAKAEQAAAEARSRDEEYLATESVTWQPRRRAVNE